MVLTFNLNQHFNTKRFKGVNYVYETCFSCFAYTILLYRYIISVNIPYYYCNISLSLVLHQITRHITIQIVTSSLTVAISCKTLMKNGSAIQSIGFSNIFLHHYISALLFLAFLSPFNVSIFPWSLSSFRCPKWTIILYLEQIDN